MPTNSTEMTEQFSIFLKGFFEAHPEMKGKPLYLAGEGVAGKVIPVIGSYMMDHQAEMIEMGADLHGVAIGNGWVDPVNQYSSYGTYAFENGLVDSLGKLFLDLGFSISQKLAKHNFPIANRYVCNTLMNYVVGDFMTPKFNMFNISQKCENPPTCFNIKAEMEFLNRDDVKETLGVAERTWVQYNMDLHTAGLKDYDSNAAPYVSKLLNADVDVLVYSGDKDFAFNWRGAESWTNALEWKDAKYFRGAPFRDIGTGTLKAYQNLAFYRVFDAGNLVSVDQPEAALDMINRFVGRT